MTLQSRLHNLLADGAWHSGATLAETLQVSRTAIWKVVTQLKAAGMAIESSRGKGYRMQSALALYDKQVILSELSDTSKNQIAGLEIEQKLDSTNSYCLRKLALPERGALPLRNGYVVLAEQQTAGRGRRGRNWQSPLGASIYMSLIWTFSQGSSALSGLSLAVGLAVVEALEKYGYSGLSLKWPNDLQWKGLKLGGILIEVTGDLAGACDTVIGIGLNLNMPEKLEIDQPWTDLSQVDPAIKLDKNLLVAKLLNVLTEKLQLFEREGFSVLRERWLQYDAFYGKDIVLALGSETRVPGRCAGVADDGSILVETAAGLQQYGGGEISLRLLDTDE